MQHGWPCPPPRRVRALVPCCPGEPTLGYTMQTLWVCAANSALDNENETTTEHTNSTEGQA